MKSILILAPTLPVDEEGNLLSGFVRIDDDGELPALLHCVPNFPVPADATVLYDGRMEEWEWLDLKVSHPEVAERALRATWNSGEKDEDGNDIIERGSIKQGKAKGKIPTPITTDEPPHYWFGEEEDAI